MQVIDQACNLPVKWALLDAKLHLFSPARGKYGIYLLAGAGIPDIIRHESWGERSFSPATRFPLGVLSCATPFRGRRFPLISFSCKTWRKLNLLLPARLCASETNVPWKYFYCPQNYISASYKARSGLMFGLASAGVNEAKRLLACFHN